ncbi:MAG: GGDEF domain-containing protein [Myxococcales bacterium]|nr:GGDEF domain-containing protein [Myxococcales bacterium]
MDFEDKPRPTNPGTPILPALQEQARIPVLTVLVGDMPGRMYRIEGNSVVLGRLPECEIQLSDDGVSRMHARIELGPLGFDVVDLESTNGTFVNGHPVSRCPVRDGDKVQCGSTAVLRFNLQDALDEAFQQQQFEQMTRDTLTECHNRLYFDEELRRESAFARRKGAQLSLAVIDVDHFKRVNDTHGHSIGDLVLREMGQRLQTEMRAYDLLARYGGEEFVALLRDADLEDAKVVAERLRLSVCNEPFKFEGLSIPISVSIGVASAKELPKNDPDALFRLADNRLYVAKGDGRNRVCSSERPAPIQHTQPVDRAEALAAIARRKNSMASARATQATAQHERSTGIRASQLPFERPFAPSLKPVVMPATTRMPRIDETDGE